MTIAVESRKKKLATLQGLWPAATIVDVTSKGDVPWVRFSPFFPHGGIPIPNSADTAKSVEGLWQGLKVFEKEGVDPKKWEITNMSGIKRSVRSRGNVLGHRFGVDSDVLLSYLDARRQIYLPAYRWVLENRLQKVVEQLGAIAKTGDLVLLDYETNGDVEDLSKPLSHAALVKMWLEDNWPK